MASEAEAQPILEPEPGPGHENLSSQHVPQEYNKID